MQIGSIVGIDIKSEANINGDLAVSDSSSLNGAGFLAMLIGVSNAQQMPLPSGIINDIVKMDEGGGGAIKMADDIGTDNSISIASALPNGSASAPVKAGNQDAGAEANKLTDINFDESKIIEADNLETQSGQQFKLSDKQPIAASVLSDYELTEKGAASVQDIVFSSAGSKGQSLISDAQSITSNLLSNTSKKSAEKIDALDMNGSDAEGDVKLLQQADNISSSAHKTTLENEMPDFAEGKNSNDSLIQPSANDPNASIGAGNVKEILTAQKGEVHNQAIDRQIETQIVEKTAQGIKVITTDSSGRARISLYPESLGHIKIDVTVNSDGIVNAKIITENPQVKEVIDSNFTRLKESLLQQGLKIDQFSVSVDQQKQNDFSDDRKMLWYKNPMSENLENGQIDYNNPTGSVLYPTDLKAVENIDIFV